MIIWDVQLRGCDLQGTEAERAVERLVKNEGQPAEIRIAAEGALKAIRQRNHFKPGQLSHITGGPCEEALGGGRRSDGG
jgi:hypothetical protein